MDGPKWTFRGPGDWYVSYGGREVAWVARWAAGEWNWSVPQAHKSGTEATATAAKAAAATAIKEYGWRPPSE